MCRHDCGFFMLQNLNSYDGNGLVIYGQKDILNIKMTLLYSWLTKSDFAIDLKAIIGVEAGSKLFFCFHARIFPLCVSVKPFVWWEVNFLFI